MRRYVERQQQQQPSFACDQVTSIKDSPFEGGLSTSDKIIKSKEMRSCSRMLRSFCTKSCKTRSIRFAITVAVVTNIGASFWIMISERSLPEYFRPDVHTSATLKSHRRCYIPTLNPFEPEIKQFMEKPIPIDCANAANPEFGKIAFEGKREGERNLLVRKIDVGVPCCYRPFKRISDVEIWLETTQNVTYAYVCHPITERETVIPPQHEFIEILCGQGGHKYKDGIAFISRIPSVENRIKTREARKQAHAKARSLRSSQRYWGKGKEKRHRLSVIILGMDSTSQMNFIRMMPKSHRYITSTLSAIQLKGYNKVGESNLANVIPLLTGLHLAELKKLCVTDNGMNSAIHLDRCPFIWKNFSAKGYRTSYAEDEVGAGIFNKDWSQAFQIQPTDHYFRTFSMRMNHNHATHGGHCHGTRMTFDILMENIKNTAAVYKHDPFFHFTWASKLTHEEFNRLAWGDLPLLSTLKYLHNNGHLNESALILVGDHGSRNEDIRRTHQGQIEDRLPLAYIVLPKWFPSRYPRAWQNLQENSEKLTTPFDIHEALKDLLDLSQLSDSTTYYERRVKKKFKSRYGFSLFMGIPESRSCIAAGIPQHWCICYKKKPILNDSRLVKSAARFAINSFNRILKPYQRICEPLRLSRVTRALQWKPDDFEDKMNLEDDGKQEEEYKQSFMIQVSFTVVPGHASFEITLLHHPNDGFKLTDEIVRLSRYEGHGDCIQQELKILCQCKKMDHTGESKSSKDSKISNRGQTGKPTNRIKTDKSMQPKK